MRQSILRSVLVITLCMGTGSPPAKADLLSVTNPGFEDISGESPFNEFTFGAFNGWDLYDPGSVAGSGAGPTYFIGTLDAEPPWFDAGAPEGDRVAIAFNFAGSGGQGEYGLVQTMTETLQANTVYELTVEIGNINEGTAINGDFFDLRGFPGYRVDLLAGDAVIAQDNNSLGGSIADGFFGTTTVSLTTGTTHAQFGQALGIRLVNLNQVDLAFPVSDLEVDFDNVRLSAQSVPEPSSLAMLLLALVGLQHRRRRE